MLWQIPVRQEQAVTFVQAVTNVCDQIMLYIPVFFSKYMKYAA